jgi:hypothetical protein
MKKGREWFQSSRCLEVFGTVGTWVSSRFLASPPWVSSQDDETRYVRLSARFCLFHLHSKNVGNGEENRRRAGNCWKKICCLCFFFRQINSMHGPANDDSEGTYHDILFFMNHIADAHNRTYIPSTHAALLIWSPMKNRAGKLTKSPLTSHCEEHTTKRRRKKGAG